MDDLRYARRFARCTCALAAILWAPALAQAALVLHPDWLGAADATLAMSLILGASLTAAPALLKALVPGGGPPRDEPRPEARR